MDAAHQISIAITHWNRFPYLRECIAPVLNDPRVAEIVISDDASTDGSWDEIQEYYGLHPKVKMFRNEQNLDCYRNKAKAMEHTTNGWTILFDSDNVLGVDYLDALYALPEWNLDTVYCPDFAEPHFNYTKFGGIMIDRTNVSLFMGKETTRMVRSARNPNNFRHRGMRQTHLPDEYGSFRTALNTCNFFVHRDQYLSVWDGSVNPHTADSIYQNFNWLKSGKRLTIVKGLRYFHRVHADSHYKLNRQLTGTFHQQVEAMLIALR